MSDRSERPTPAAPSRIQQLEAQIARFAPALQPQLRTLCHNCSRFGDLVTTHPAAAVAQVTLHGSDQDRIRALELVRNGRPVAEVAAALGLPNWFRRLPPEAFRSRADLRSVPLDPQHVMHVIQRIPDEPKCTATWLDLVRRAAHAADSDFAVWVAGLPIPASADCLSGLPELMGAFAWISRHQPETIEWLGIKPFSLDMSFMTAVKALERFRVMVHTCSLQGRPGIVETWLVADEVDGFEFVPLRTMQGLREESVAMHNCAHQYLVPMAEDVCRLFSIRRNGAPVATLEIRSHPLMPDVPHIHQLRGVGNVMLDKGVSRLVYKWLGGQPEYALPRVAARERRRRVSRRFWCSVFEGYLEARGPSLFVPARPSRDTLRLFEATVARLHRMVASRISPSVIGRPD
jgi:hypothetical protein